VDELAIFQDPEELAVDGAGDVGAAESWLFAAAVRVIAVAAGAVLAVEFGAGFGGCRLPGEWIGAGAVGGGDVVLPVIFRLRV